MTDNKSLSAELEACPFCGVADALTVSQTMAAGLMWWSVECHGCRVSLSGDHTEAAAISAWNTRATIAGNTGLREAIGRAIVTAWNSDGNCYKNWLPPIEFSEAELGHFVNHLMPLLSIDRREVEDTRLREANRRLRLTEGCLDCNANDARFWRELIKFLEEVA